MKHRGAKPAVHYARRCIIDTNLKISTCMHATNLHVYNQFYLAIILLNRTLTVRGKGQYKFLYNTCVLTSTDVGHKQISPISGVANNDISL